jgi:PAS domain S-box-containing protein
MIGAVQDVTEQRAKELQLVNSNDRFNAVLKATHDLIWDWDLLTGVFYRDPEGQRRVYGVDNDEEISNIYSWMKRIHPDDHVHVQEVIGKILNATNEETFDLEYRFRTDEGSYNSVYDRGFIIRDSNGRPVRMIGAAQNITDRKKLEQELLQRELERQKMVTQATIETQEQERSEIGKELHDNVNQILTTTKLYLDLAHSNPELKDDLISKSTRNIIYVINEIRQLSRSLMDPTLGDLGLLDSIKDLIENTNTTRKLQVKLQSSGPVEEKLDSPSKLTIFRIIQEALNNAIRHSEASDAVVTLTMKNENVLLSIKDNGVGFSPKTVKKGAGLRNIQNRVYLANGSFSIKSNAGKGCNLKIILPINHPDIRD